MLVDGRDVREVRREDLWQLIGVIPQNAFLFSGTIASNIRYGAADASDDEVRHALDIAQAGEFRLGVQSSGGICTYGCETALREEDGRYLPRIST